MKYRYLPVKLQTSFNKLLIKNTSKKIKFKFRHAEIESYALRFKLIRWIDSGFFKNKVKYLFVYKNHLI